MFHHLSQLARAFAVVAALAAPGLRLAAEDAAVVRPVNSSYMLESGTSHLCDTYLSPLKYTGWMAGFTYERLQAMKFSPDSWRQQLILHLEVNRAENPARNSTLMYLNLAASWGMMHKWNFSGGRFSAALGGRAGGNIGGLYCNRNSNNPAALKADLSLDLTGWLTWKFRLWKLPVMLRWQSAMPLTGIFFSPEYDELYYEIWLGNSHGLVHAIAPWNYFRWDNLVTADLDFGNTDLRLGFRSNVYSSEVNHITTRILTWSFVVGCSGDWLSISPGRVPSADTQRIVWAY